MTHLCLIVDRKTNKQLAEYEVEAESWYCARNIAINRFQEEKRNIASSDWCVDSIEL